MRERDVRPYLRDILGAMDTATAFVRGLRFDDFEADLRTQYALVRAIEIVGEAARRLGPEVHARFPDVPWRAMIAQRNVLAHGYDLVRLDALWQAVHESIPATRPLVQAALDAGG